MALNPQKSTALKNLMLMTGVGNVFDGGVLEIRSGTQPTNADTAPQGSLLSSIILPTPAFSAASAGQRVKAGVWEDLSADATGTAAWFRLRTSTDLGSTNTTDVRLDGTIGVTAGLFDLVANTTAIVATKPVSIEIFPLVMT
jgi:hypothetical protein